jgi:UDP-N-acetylmuramyl pentapeptide synthase
MVPIIALIIFFSLPFVIVTLRNILWDTYLWQTKEYRLDRVWANLLYEKSEDNRNDIYTYVKIALFTTSVIYYFEPKAEVLLLGIIIAFIVYWNESVHFLQKLLAHKLARPRLKSPRNLIIMAISFVIILLPYFYVISWVISLPFSSTSSTPNASSGFSYLINGDFSEVLPRTIDGVLVIPLGLVLVEILSIFGIAGELTTPFWVSLIALLTDPLAKLRRRMMIDKAKQKLTGYPKIKVVGVTGSYGKSTTKELIAQLLASKYKVVKTQKNNNTDVGVAQTILRDVNEGTEIFVAEMGAYKPGEIKSTTEITPPDIAVVTGIDQQHVTLFGGIEKTMKAKYEIIEGLKKDGLAVFNGDNEYCMRLAEKCDKRKQIYFSIENQSIVTPEIDDEITEREPGHFPQNENLYASDIVVKENGIEFVLHQHGKKYNLKTNLPARYQINNLLAAIVVAAELGMSVADIVKVINHTTFVVPYLQIKFAINDSKLIDDGYNVNPTGFAAGLEFLAAQKTDAKKWVMTQGFLELGEEKKAVYNKLAKEIAKVADGVITSDNDLLATLAATKTNTIAVDSVYSFPVLYEANVKKNDYVLMEGAFPQVVISKILGDA